MLMGVQSPRGDREHSSYGYRGNDLETSTKFRKKRICAKAIMEEDFKKNAKKPGDDGYIHDKRMEFEARRK